MPDSDEPNVIPIDPTIREVLDEFANDPMAMANEIVALRQELFLRAATSRPIVLERPPAPPDLPPRPSSSGIGLTNRYPWPRPDPSTEGCPDHLRATQRASLPNSVRHPAFGAPVRLQ